MQLPNYNHWYGQSHKPGFNIVEVVIVVAIIATLSAVAVPRYVNSLTRFRLNAAARRVAADLKLAQTTAKQSSASRQVVFDVANETYQLQNVTPLDGSGANYDVDLKEEPYYARIVSANFAGDALVIFDGYGQPDSNGTVVVQVGSDQRQVDVDANTGEINIQ